MVGFLLTVVAAGVVAVVGFGIAAFTLGRGGGLSSPEPDSRATDVRTDLPGNRPLQPAEIAGLRFDVALRGYRMGQVDGALRRLGIELKVRDAEIRRLRAASGLSGPPDLAAGPPEDQPVAFPGYGTAGPSTAEADDLRLDSPLARFGAYPTAEPTRPDGPNGSGQDVIGEAEAAPGLEADSDPGSYAYPDPDPEDTDPTLGRSGVF